MTPVPHMRSVPLAVWERVREALECPICVVRGRPPGRRWAESYCGLAAECRPSSTALPTGPLAPPSWA